MTVDKIHCKFCITSIVISLILEKSPWSRGGKEESSGHAADLNFGGFLFYL